MAAIPPSVAPPPREDEVIIDTTLLVGDPTIHFRGQHVDHRKNVTLKTKYFYRAAYEESGTRSAFFGKENHKTCTEDGVPEFMDSDAYVPFKYFYGPRDLTKPRIQRAFKAQKKDASSYVSVFDDLEKAKAHASKRAKVNKPRGARNIISEISAVDLVPAVVLARYQTSTSAFKKRAKGEDESIVPIRKGSVKTRGVRIPVWVRKSVMPANGSSVLLDKWQDLHAEMWICVEEVKLSDYGGLHVEASPRHNGEWLCCGAIKRTSVTKVMPYDGETEYHEDDKNHLVRSKINQQWIWDWSLSRWVLDPAVHQVTHITSNKRPRSDTQGNNNDAHASANDVNDIDSDDEDSPRPAQIPRLCQV
ncbi:hypothetical protein N0V86_006510 [Didymella sp. IMI 355093]|nr:hypothetical protein N0V86_006510 [Didymella sp. IMI 355093]